jgi:hypothetical protein
MDIDQSFPSKYLKADDLQGREVEVTIDSVELNKMGSADDAPEKPVVFFEGKEKGLVLNKTNSAVIKEAYGRLTEEWAGQPLILYPTTTQFKGQLKPCLRVRVPREPAEGDEEIPF